MVDLLKCTRGLLSASGLVEVLITMYSHLLRLAKALILQTVRAVPLLEPLPQSLPCFTSQVVTKVNAAIV